MGNTQSKLSEIQEENMTIPIPMKVKDVNDSENIKGDWVKYNMRKEQFIFGVGGMNEFEVYVLVDGNDVFMKPVKMVMTYEFEHLFNFGIGCDRYDANQRR